MTVLPGEIAQRKATGTTEGSAVFYDDPQYGMVVYDGALT
jgi:hypothetical protein